MAINPRSRLSSALFHIEAIIQRYLDSSPLLRKVIYAIAIIHPILQLGFWLPLQWSHTDQRRDITVYYHAAQHVVNHQSLYQPMPWVGPDVNPEAYLYPPQSAILLAPLGHLSFGGFSMFWYTMLVVAFWIFAWSLDRLAARAPSVRGTLFWGLALAATPGAYEAMSEGQADPIVWALFGLALATRYRGVMFALMTQVKLFGMLPLAYAAWREGRTVAAPAGWTLFAGFFIGGLVFGPQAFIDWVRWSLSLPSQGHFDEYNISLSFLALRIARATGVWHYPGGPLAPLPHLYLQAALAAAIIASFWFTRRMPSPQNYIVVLLTVLIFSPTCWYTYVPLAYTLVAVSLARNGATGGASNDTAGRGERT